MDKDSALTVGTILKWVPIISGFVGITLWCGNINSKVNALDGRQTATEIKSAKVDDNYNELKNSVTRIETLLEERLPPKK